MNLKEITLENNNIKVKFLALGGIITHFSSKKDNINCVMRFGDLNDYIINRGFLGATVGPLAGRTEFAKFKINDREYQLDQNVPPHHLHGGINGLSKREFTIKEQSDTYVLFNDYYDYTKSGYPGTLNTYIKYSIHENTFSIEITAVPSTTMPINITNHTYFNLDGDSTIKHHHLSVIADEVVYVSENGSNTSNIKSVENSVFDLNKTQKIESILKQTHPQFEITRHLDHTYINNSNSVVTLYNNQKSKSLTIDFTAPAFQIYLANYFDGTLIDEHNRYIQKNAAIAIEPQNIPNEINIFGKQLYDAVNPFESKISYTLK